MKFKISKYLHVFEDKEILEDNIILFSTRSGVSIELNKELYEKIKSIEIESLPSEIVANLIKSEFYVPEDEDELNEILRNNIMSVKHIDKETLSYVIQPSGNCQLGCHYCGQLHTNKVMKKDVLDLIYQRIESKTNELEETLKKMNITWYGGEPLTGLSALSELSSKLIALAKDKNLKYSSNIVSNALNLKVSTFEKLVNDFQITDFQITVDGMKEFHNKRRFLKSGEESFDIIIENIKNIVKTDLYKEKANINLRCNVDQENKENVLDFIDYLAEEEILPYVSFYVSPIHDWGDNKATIKGISNEEFAELEIEVMMKLLDLKTRFKKMIIPQRNTRPCMVVSKTSEVLDAFGNVSTCWEVPYTPYYENSDYYAGNLLKNKDISSDNVIMRNWFKEIPTNKSWCKTCKFLPLCGGACPKNWNEGTPACPTFKFNINDRLLLQRYINERTNNKELVGN